MTEPSDSDHDIPRDVDAVFDVEIALSADIDGELAGYAAELGVDEAALRQRIAADPRADETRAALVAARTELAVPNEPLDELTRARFVAAALTERPAAAGGSAPRDRGWMARAAVAATIVIVAVGGAVAVIANRQNDDARNSASTGSVRSGDVGDIGNIDQKKLDELIGGPARSSGSVPAPEAAKSGAADSESTLSTNPDTSVDGFDPNSSARARSDQVAKCLAAPPVKGPIRFSGSGAYQGRPAVILGISKGARTIVFVVAADDCAQVLFSVSR